jgi:hypothetical protein
MTKRPQNKHLRPLPGLVALQDGESTNVYRVRGREEVLAWWGSLTAAQRGGLVEELFMALAGEDDPAYPERDKYGKFRRI